MINFLFYLLISLSYLFNPIERTSWINESNGINQVRIYSDNYFVVSNYNINNTVIDGSTATDDYGSCILIYSPSGDCISPEVTGFTIRNGLGTLVLRDINAGTILEDQIEQRIGGGILFDISDPAISFNQIEDNGSTEVFSGGGSYGTTLEEDWSFNNRDLNGRARCDIDAFNLENNLYDGNDALYGNTFSNVGFIFFCQPAIHIANSSNLPRLPRGLVSSF